MLFNLDQVNYLDILKDMLSIDYNTMIFFTITNIIIIFIIINNLNQILQLHLNVVFDVRKRTTLPV